MRTPIPVKEAIERVIKVVKQLETETVSINESLNYILAEDIQATYDIPRFDKSPTMGSQLKVLILKGQQERIEYHLKL